MTRLIFSSLAIVVLISTMAIAQPRLGVTGKGNYCFENLELSPDQKGTIKELRREANKKNIDLRAAIQKLRLDVQSQMDSEKPNRNTYERLLKEISDLQLQQKLLRFDLRQDILNTLTSDQRQSWLELRATCKKESGSRTTKRFGRQGAKSNRGGRVYEKSQRVN